MKANKVPASRRGPRQLTEVMIRTFQNKTATLFSPTRPADFHEFEKGLYGVLYVKPIRRIARMLTADREILTLFSSFVDQQPRTIETAINLIDREESRLEHTIAIIVHADPEGSPKLKNWGREQGLTVLPIFLSDTLPEGGELERLVLQEFYSHDPFDVSGPVSDDSKFYGRRSEAQDIARQLQTGQVRACLGIRKIGKTSIINRVLAETREGHQCYTIMVDCSKDSIWEASAGCLLASVASAVDRAIEEPSRYSDAEVFPDTATCSISEGQRRLVVAIRRSTLPVLIFFDESDYITPGSPTAYEKWRSEFNPFWRNLRTVYQEISRSDTRMSILVSGVSSKWFRIESVDGVENAALAFIPEEYLSPMASGACVAMIKNIAKACGLYFDTAPAELIAEACSGMPYWIRKACSFIHRNVDVEVRPYAPSREEVQALLDGFVETEGAAIAEVALGHLFRVYPELAPVAVNRYNQMEVAVNLQLCSVLCRYGVLSRTGNNHIVSGMMMRAGMRLYVEQQEVGETSASSHIAYGSLEEWADELALINASRNRLEKRLRATVLNFIRFAVLQNRQGGSLLERVGGVLEEKRRAKLKHLAADELIEKFNWSDLIALMLREWSLFSSVFNDKAVFNQYAKIINERFDAHAKDADKADLALYRRAIRWFEECMGRV